MSPRPNPAATQHPAVELRVLDSAGEDLAFVWQVHGHGHLLAHGRVAGPPNTPELAGWRYQAFTEAAQAAIAALQDLEATHRPAAGDDPTSATQQERPCDFCATAPAAWRYPARPDPLTVRTDDVLVLLQGGDWHACPVCYLLVEAGRWAALSQRAARPAGQGEALWATFRASRTGPAVPLDPHPRSRGDA